MKQDLYVLAAVVTCLALVIGVAAVADGRGRSVGRAAAGTVLSADAPEASGGHATARRSHSDLLARDRGDATGRLFAETRPEVNKAAGLLKMAYYARDDRQALAYLDRVVSLDLSPDDPTVRKVLYGAHLELAEVYAYATEKRVHHLSAAARLTDSPVEQERLARIVDGLGRAVAVGRVEASMPRSFGVADHCDEATPLTLGAPGQSEIHDLTIEAGGDFEWYVVEVPEGAPLDGLRLLFETVSDQPGDPADDDTELRLYGDCDAASGEGLDPIGFDDDGGAGYMSRLESGCLPGGTYFLRVAGWNETAKADDITLEAGVTEECVVPEPDRFEPDDDRDHASKIKLARARRGEVPSSVRPVGRERQAHNVFPAGDEDWVKFGLKRDSMVRIRTACGFPTIFNDFADCDGQSEFDTVVSLRYASPVTTYGLCNQSFTGVPGQISTRVGNACTSDLDCDFNDNGVVYPEDPDDLVDPLEGLPACLPWDLFPEGQRPVDPFDNALAFVDDVDVGAGNLGADLTLCLPRTRRSSPSLSVQADPVDRFDWYVQVGGWSPSGDPSQSSLTFDYEVYIENLEPCAFEIEPNDSFYFSAGDDDDDDDDDGSYLALDGTSRHGIWDFSATQPGNDYDLYRFDVDEAGVVLFETDGYDAIAVDTFIEIWVGPDANGEYFLTGHENDDIGVFDRRSRLEATLVPACEAVGRDCGPAKAQPRDADPESLPPASYFLNVTSAFVQPNFPYEVRAEALADVTAEFADFGDVGDLPAWLEPGERAKARIDRGCDLDGYRFTLEDDARIGVVTRGPGIDTALQLVECDSFRVLGCDDDSGPGLASAIDGCLAGGRDYCVRVRSFDGRSVFDYDIEIENRGACTPAAALGVTPEIVADGANVCRASTASAFEEFAGCEVEND